MFVQILKHFIMRSLGIIITFLFFSSVSVFSQTADEIVDAYYGVIGGKDNWKKVNSVRMSGKVNVQGMQLPVVMLQKPSRQKVSITFQGMEIVQPAFDGETAWQTNFMTMKAEKMDAESSALMKDEVADFPDALLNYKVKGYTLDYIGNAVVDGTDCHKLKLTKKPALVDGNEVRNESFFYFDKDNNVLIATEVEIKSGPMKGKFSLTSMSEYEEVNGLYFPMSLTTKMDGQTQAAIKIEKVEINVPLEEALFAFPE
jgi:outer membrane lipoprotein-sorting protein